MFRTNHYRRRRTVQEDFRDYMHGTALLFPRQLDVFFAANNIHFVHLVYLGRQWIFFIRVSSR